MVTATTWAIANALKPIALLLDPARVAEIVQPAGGVARVPDRPTVESVSAGDCDLPVLSSTPTRMSVVPGGMGLRTLSRSFYDRDPREVGPDLLGKILVRKQGKRKLTARIVEVEAYLGADDPAAHASIGKTLRNAVLFGRPGHAYVYFIYGNHYCLNVSCLPDGTAGGILFRALEPLEGVDEMFKLRGLSRHSDLRRLTSGPGRLAAAFGITRERDNGKDLTNARSDLQIADAGASPPEVLITKRIGIKKAVEMPLRYIVAGNRFVSGRI